MDEELVRTFLDAPANRGDLVILFLLLVLATVLLAWAQDHWDGGEED